MFLEQGIPEKDLFELIAEVGKRSPREIVRRINGLIVKWRISKCKNGDSEPYDLLAGLINEMISERETKNVLEYKPFRRFIGAPTSEAGSITYGQSMAEALEKTRNVTYHEDIINNLEKDLGSEKSPTMNSLIDILKKDEHLCSVLNSNAGRYWLSDKKYREEMRDTYEETKPGKEALKYIRAGRDETVLSLKSDLQLPEDFEHAIQDLRMIPIEAGVFNMGSDDGIDNEKPIHRVKLDGFKISATLVTQAQYEKIMGVNPSHFKGDGHKGEAGLPVEKVSWNDAMVFCEQLTKLSKGKGRFTLPTEAQWEYACRAGTTTEFNTGDNLTTDQANYNGNYPYKNNQKGKYLEKTTPVDRYPANAWGIYDMHGNVWEWCLDWYDEKYYEKCNEKGVVENPQGPDGGSDRVLRGGGWNISEHYCRSAYRGYSSPGSRGDGIGFRLVFVP